jgi:hypothetical protein
MTLSHSEQLTLHSGIDLAGTTRRNWWRMEMASAVSAAVHWLHVGRQGAAPAVAAIMPLVESCLRMGINARAYLDVVLPQLASTHLEEVAEFPRAREQPRWQAS